MKKAKQQSLVLGCGLIRIGRVWGVDNKLVPSDVEAQSFLAAAFELGVRFFDTAPAYGLSEIRLGHFLRSLTDDQRRQVTVATKFGEHWNSERQEPYVDHTLPKLQLSLETSLSRLGTIDVLQLHKATKEVLTSQAVDTVFTSALEANIPSLGASISDLETGFLACEDKRLTYIQLPYNQEKIELQPVIERANKAGKRLLFNRPFAMGAIAKNEPSMIGAYHFILQTQSRGVVLTGTASREHLEQNLRCFERATYAF